MNPCASDVGLKHVCCVVVVRHLQRDPGSRRVLDHFSAGVHFRCCYVLSTDMHGDRVKEYDIAFDVGAASWRK